jgi:hypothetical protein
MSASTPLATENNTKGGKRQVEKNVLIRTDDSGAKDRTLPNLGHSLMQRCTAVCITKYLSPVVCHDGKEICPANTKPSFIIRHVSILPELVRCIAPYVLRIRL